MDTPRARSVKTKTIGMNLKILLNRGIRRSDMYPRDRLYKGISGSKSIPKSGDSANLNSLADQGGIEGRDNPTLSIFSARPKTNNHREKNVKKSRKEGVV